MAVCYFVMGFVATAALGWLFGPWLPLVAAVPLAIFVQANGFPVDLSLAYGGTYALGHVLALFAFGYGGFIPIQYGLLWCVAVLVYIIGILMYELFETRVESARWRRGVR